MQFDPNATLIAICAIVAFLGLQSLFFWIRDRQAPWLAWFGLALLWGSAAVLIYLVPARGPDFLQLGLGNALRIGGFAFLWHCTRTFAGRRPEHLVLLLAVAIWLALCSLPAFLGNMPLRVVGGSVFIAAFCGLAAWELWRIRAEPLPSLRPAMWAFASFTIVTLLRIPLVNAAPFPVGALPLDGRWAAGFGLVVFVHATFVATLMQSMTRERRELEQRRYALSDPLTGMFNRRAFIDEAERVARHRHRGGREALSVLVLDLDDFKSVNDRYGHEAGDRVLQQFGVVARAATRASDLLYRMGGEEFCFVLPATALDEARVIAERIRQCFAEATVDALGEPIRASVSVGVVTAEEVGFDLELLLAAGDTAVYEAKARGRNRTVVGGSMAPVAPVEPAAVAA
ncbi:MAG: GGDEF domain-containing protein [Devosia sp.]